jgi:hypothetical protein
METRKGIPRFVFGIVAMLLGINTVWAAEPFENLPIDTVLVEILGQKVYFKDIEPNLDAQAKKRGTMTNEQFTLWLKQTRSSNLGRYFKPLWNEYVKEKRIVVTEREIKEYKDKMISFMTAQKQEWKRKRDNLARELIAENLKEDKKAELEKNFNLYNRLIEKSPDPNLIYYSSDPNTAKLIDDVPKSFIRSCKINQALYHQYKGRVIFQQAGPEPLDAFRQFFEKQQSKGKFKFYNKDAEDLFWDYYKNVKHTFLSDPNEVERMMNTPWWSQGKKDNDGYAEAEWGEEVNGLQIRIDGDSGRRAFYADKTPTFKIDLLNTSDKFFSAEADSRICEVEVDGKRYEWGGPGPFEIQGVRIDPKKVYYDIIQIELSENWILKGISQKENEKIHLNLSSGLHVIRVKWKMNLLPERTSVTVVVSNSLKFQIIPPRADKSQER